MRERRDNNTESPVHAEHARWRITRLIVSPTVTALVASQDAVEKELFELQNKVGAMLRANFELEDRVIAAEKLLPAGK